MIKNGSSTPLNQNDTLLPDVGPALLDWFQDLTFTIITKTSENFVIEESRENVNFKGVVQQLSARELAIKPEGQRNFGWWQVHAEPSLILDNDNVIGYLGVNYRIMKRVNHKKYGYVEYHMVEDFDGTAV